MNRCPSFRLARNYALEGCGIVGPPTERSAIQTETEICPQQFPPLYSSVAQYSRRVVRSIMVCKRPYPTSFYTARRAGCGHLTEPVGHFNPPSLSKLQLVLLFVMPSQPYSSTFVGLHCNTYIPYLLREHDESYRIYGASAQSRTAGTTNGHSQAHQVSRGHSLHDKLQAQGKKHSLEVLRTRLRADIKTSIRIANRTRTSSRHLRTSASLAGSLSNLVSLAFQSPFFRNTT